MQLQQATPRSMHTYAEERRAIDATVATIEDVIERLEAAPNPWLRRLTVLTDRLADLLRHHYARETINDDDGGGGEFEQLFPRFCNALREIRRQHELVLGQVLRLRAACAVHVMTNHAPASILREARELTQLMQRLERQESEILQGAYIQDIGLSG